MNYDHDNIKEDTSMALTLQIVSSASSSELVKSYTVQTDSAQSNSIDSDSERILYLYSNHSAQSDPPSFSSRQKDLECKDSDFEMIYSAINEFTFRDLVKRKIVELGLQVNGASITIVREADSATDKDFSYKLYRVKISNDTNFGIVLVIYSREAVKSQILTSLPPDSHKK